MQQTEKNWTLKENLVSYLLLVHGAVLPTLLLSSLRVGTFLQRPQTLSLLSYAQFLSLFI